MTAARTKLWEWAVRSTLITFVTWFGGPTPAAAQKTIHVPADQSTIQAGIDAAANGDTVLVSDGTYKENIDFKAKAITVTSVNGASATIIDGGGLDTVVKFVTQETPSSVLSGFTIQNGRPAASTNDGGGIAVSNSSPTILNNTITGNVACTGAGIGVFFGSPLIQGNTITNNSQGGCSGGTGGGGILLGGAASAQILNNTISNNSMGSDGGGISLNAAGTPTIRGNIMTGNSSGSQGGGISMANQSDALITDNLIAGNTAALQGGGIYVGVPSGANGPTIVNNTIANNSAVNSGSQVYFSGFPNQTQFVNNIFFGIASQVAVACDTAYSPQAPILQFNDTFNPQGTPYSGSCVGETGTNGNISADPLFVNPAASDFHLQATSPAIDAGLNAAASLPTKDFDGHERILDGNGDCIATVDIGAYEFARPSVLTLSPNLLAFPDQLVSTTSAALSSAITNTASTATTVCGFSVTGDFSQTNTCASSIAAKGTCSVNVDFTPTAHGPRSGLLQLITSDAGSPQTITLTGKGVVPNVALSGNALNFAAQQVGTTSSAQTVTLNNIGDGQLIISNVTASGDFSQSNTCGTAVAPGANCTFSVRFAPTASGSRTGSLSITDNAGGSPHTVRLTGSATDFALASAAGGSTTATVTDGQTATYSLQVSSLNGFTGTVGLGCAGAPSLAVCTVAPASVALNGPTSAPFTVTVTTTAPSLTTPPAAPREWPPIKPQFIELALLLALLLFAWQVRLQSKASSGKLSFACALAIFSIVLVTASGCGGGGGVHNPGTPHGTSSLTITGTSGGASRTLDLKLTVN